MADKLTRSNSSKAVKGLVKEAPPSPSTAKEKKDKDKEKKAKLTRSNSSTSVKDGIKKENKEEPSPEPAPEAAPSKSTFANLFGKKKTTTLPPTLSVNAPSSARNRSHTSTLQIPPSTSVTSASPRADKEKKEEDKKKNRKSIGDKLFSGLSGDKKSRPKSTAIPSETLSSLGNKQQSENERLPALTYESKQVDTQPEHTVPSLALPVPTGSSSAQPSPVSPSGATNAKKPPTRSNSLRSLKNLLKKDTSQPPPTSTLSSGSSSNVALPKSDPVIATNVVVVAAANQDSDAPKLALPPPVEPVTAEVAPYNPEVAAAASGAAKAAKSVVKAEQGLNARTDTSAATRPELQRSSSASLLMTGLAKSGYKDVSAVSVAVKKARRSSVDDTSRKVDEFKSRGVGASEQKDERELPTTDEFNDAFIKAQKAARRMSQTMLMSGFGMTVKPRKPKGPSTAMKPFGAQDQEASEELVLYKGDDGPDLTSKIGNVLALAGRRAKKMSLTALLNSAVGFNKFTNMFLGMTDELDDLELEEEEGINPYMFFDPNAKFLPEEAESLNPDQKARNKVINELIKTEREYVRDLEFLHARFIVPLKAENIIAEELVTSMFSGLSIISALHKELLYDLIKQVLNSKGEVVGPIFVKMGAFLKMYAQYCGNQNQIIEQYNATLKKHSSFEKFVHEKENHELGRPLTTFLTKPYIRICTYASYLSRLLRATPDTHPDHSSLKTALGQIEQVSVALNEITKKVESGHATYDVWNKLVDGDKYHLWDDKSRLYLKEGLVKELDNDERRPREVYLVLFNNLIIKTEQKADGKLQVKGGVPLDKAILTINDDDALMQNYFTLNYYPPGRSFKANLIVICGDRVEKKEWIDYLKQIVQVKEKAQAPDAPTAITLARPTMTLVPLNTGQPGMGVGGPVKIAGGAMVLPKVDAAYTANASISTILASFTAKQTIATLTAAAAKHQSEVKKPDQP